MRTTIALATFLVVGAGAVGVSALDLKGSDTLEGITKALLLDAALDCGGTGNTPAGGLVYVGTGSSNGESAILSNTQAVSPMSRFLNPAIPGTTGQVCSLPNTAAAGSPSQQTSEGIVFALDGLSIVASLKTFDIVLSMTRGGPGRASETLALTMYRETFVNSDYGLGSAIAVFLSVVTLIASVLYLRQQLSQKHEM